MSRPRGLKPILATAGALTLAAALSGCVAEVRPGVYVPPGVEYVRPVREAPGPGWFWNYRAEDRRWAWWHHERGWYPD